MKLALTGALALCLVAATGAQAGGKHCTASTQECLDKLTKDLASRGWLGVELEPAENGMTIRKVVDSSPAARAGLAEGDVLVAVNGKAYASMSEADHESLKPLITPGSELTYGVSRDGKTRDMKVVLGAMPDQVRAQIIGGHLQSHSAMALEQRAAIHEMDIDKVAELLKMGKAVAVDANGREVREKFGVIPGAALLTSASSWNASEIPAAAKDKMLVFYCANSRCTASDAAAKLAKERGYEHVGILRVGIMGWKDAGQKTSSPAST